MLRCKSIKEKYQDKLTENLYFIDREDYYAR